MDGTDTVVDVEVTAEDGVATKTYTVQQGGEKHARVTWVLGCISMTPMRTIAAEATLFPVARMEIGVSNPTGQSHDVKLTVFTLEGDWHGNLLRAPPSEAGEIALWWADNEEMTGAAIIPELGVPFDDRGRAPRRSKVYLSSLSRVPLSPSLRYRHWQSQEG